jgi:hypothetical protein
MKDGLALIHKIWSDLKEKECCRMVVNVERVNWRNGNKIGIRSSWIKKERRRRDPRWQVGHRRRPLELREPGTVLRHWRHPWLR